MTTNQLKQIRLDAGLTQVQLNNFNKTKKEIEMKIKESYSSKQAAKNAMWSYVKSLQIDGLHTGALCGDNGLTAQWISNDGRTQWATVDHDDNYFVADRKWFVRLSTDEG